MKMTILFTLIFSLFAFTSCQTASTGKVSNTPANASSNEIKQTSKLDDRTQKALLAALADERRAQAEYEAVVAKFGDARPFSNIVNAEKRHESFLLPLFEKYAAEVPKNEFNKDKMTTPATLAEACQNGVTGEKVNIALYNGFLEFVKEPDIREVFEYLRDASQNNHLPAFERCGNGRGMGNGRG